MKSQLRLLSKGFSLIELLVYMAILSIISVAIWDGILYVQQQDIKTTQMITSQDQSDAICNQIKVLINSATGSLTVVPPPAGSPNFSEPNSCVEITTSAGITSLWIRKELSNGQVGLYRREGGDCRSTPSEASLSKISDSIYTKYDAGADYFSLTGQTLNVNLKNSATQSTLGRCFVAKTNVF